ncbi:hypothetical protein Q3G72_027560 [Acer saccharum]|nr:hypothetical protein Q3G72_027560 [Acer saccharum]
MGKEPCHAHKNLDVTFAKEVSLPSIPMETIGNQLLPHKMGKGGTVHEKTEESRVPIKNVESTFEPHVESETQGEQAEHHGEPVMQKEHLRPRIKNTLGLVSTEMEVDNGLLCHKVSSRGEDELIKNQNGPKVSARRSRNTIKGLYDKTGIWRDLKEDIAMVVDRYFSKIFCSNRPSAADLGRVLDCVQPCLPSDKCNLLDARFTPDEVRRAVFDMAPSKTPGLLQSSTKVPNHFIPL